MDTTTARTWSGSGGAPGPTYAGTLGPAIVEKMLRDLDENGSASMLPHGSHGFCATYAGEIVGTTLYGSGQGVAYLWGLYVRPAHQRADVGMMLLRAVREVVAELPIEAWVLHASTHAMRFYQSQGFEAVEDERVEILKGIEATCAIMRQPSASRPSLQNAP